MRLLFEFVQLEINIIGQNAMIFHCKSKINVVCF